MSHARKRIRVTRLRLATAGVGLVALIAVMSLPSPGHADQQNADRLSKLQQAIKNSQQTQKNLGKKARHLKTELAELRAEAIDAAAEVQRQEDRLTELEVQYRALQRRRREQRQAFRINRDGLTSTLGALSRLARRPPQLLLFDQAEAEQTWRSTALLSKALPVMRQRARVVGDRIAVLRILADDIAAEKTTLIVARRSLLDRRNELDRLIAATAKAQGLAAADRKKQKLRGRKLARQAKNLSALVDRLAREDPAAALVSGANTPAEAARPSAETDAGPVATANLVAPSTLDRGARDIGELPLPARGRLTRRFGAADDQGRPSKGLTLQTRHGAAVIAPSDGKVMFAGPFRGYGQLLIIAFGKGYHVLLAGLSRIDVSVGQWLLAGEPVGSMSQRPKEVANDRRPQLYLELRRNGNPINPLPWIAAGKRKASG